MIFAGICNTDLELQRGYHNFCGIPGHEFVARVVACDNPALLHKRVVGEINLTCHECDLCMAGLNRHCRNRTVLGILKHPGSFSEFFTLPECNLHIVPDVISDREAVFAEPLAAACEILDQIPLVPGARVAVLGDGKLGLLITQVLLANHLHVSLYGRHQSKLDLARNAGAEAFLSTGSSPSTYSCVVECTGSAEGLATAVQMTNPTGTVVLKSTVHDSVSIDMVPIIVNELTLLGSRCGRFEPALKLLEDHQVQVNSMIAAEFPLRRALSAFEQASTKGTLKVLLHP